MATLKFYIRSTKKEGTAKIRIRLSNGKNSDLNAKTKLIVPILAWDNVKQRIKPDYKFDNEFTIQNADLITEEKNKLETYIYTSFNQCTNVNNDKKWLEKIVQTYYNEQNKNNKNTELNHVPTYIKQFVKEASEGKRFTKQGTRYEDRSLNSYRNLFTLLLEYEKFHKTKIYFDDIDMDFYQTFLHFMYIERNNQPNTVNLKILFLKRILRASYSDGIHKNTITMNSEFKGVLKKVKKVYFDDNRINELSRLSDKLYNAFITRDKSNLDDNFKKLSMKKIEAYLWVLDKELIGYFTGQRISDFMKISNANVISIENKDFIEIKQRKTRKEITFPAFDVVLKLLKRQKDYTYSIKTNDMFNTHLRTISELCNYNEIVTIERFEKGKPITERKPFFACVTSHIARRSLVTNLKMKSASNELVMTFTGHANEATVNRYDQALVIQKANTAANNSIVKELNELTNII